MPVTFAPTSRSASTADSDEPPVVITSSSRTTGRPARRDLSPSTRRFEP
jgi:hypothetical protein